MGEPVRLHTDGGARGNPGPAGIGVVLLNQRGDVVAEFSEGIGPATNNVAEYTALVRGLKMAREMEIEELEVFMDSQFIIRQMQGRYKVKSPGLIPLHTEARHLAAEFNKIKFVSVPRENNAHADALVNRAIDEWLIDHPNFAAASPPSQMEFDA